MTTMTKAGSTTVSRQKAAVRQGAKSRSSAKKTSLQKQSKPKAQVNTSTDRAAQKQAQQPPTANASKSATPVDGTNKAQAIRDMAKQIGGRPRPKDIIVALAEKGITVVSAQVSTVLKAAGLGRRRRRKQRPTTAATNLKAPSLTHMIDVGELMKVKKLADEVGGAAQLKALLVALERLV